LIGTLAKLFRTRYNKYMQLLTVRELAKQLLDEDMDAVVAIENNGRTHATTLMSECWQSGTFWMKRTPRVQKEYLCEDEIPTGEKSDYIKVLVMSAIVSNDEI